MQSKTEEVVFSECLEGMMANGMMASITRGSMVIWRVGNGTTSGPPTMATAHIIAVVLFYDSLIYGGSLIIAYHHRLLVSSTLRML